MTFQIMVSATGKRPELKKHGEEPNTFPGSAYANIYSHIDGDDSTIPYSYDP